MTKGNQADGLVAERGAATDAETLEVDCTVVDDRWNEVPGLAALAYSAAEAAVEQSDLAANGTVELSVVFSADAHLCELNSQYRDKAVPTNVLSFPAGPGGGDGEMTMLGDVILAFETITRESSDQGKTFENHLRHLIVHGVLHLLGYDHDNDSRAHEMETREIAALAHLGVPNPYE